MPEEAESVGRQGKRTLDPAPLLALFPPRQETDGCWFFSRQTDASGFIPGGDPWIAHRIGVSSALVARWRNGSMDVGIFMADRISIQNLGRHPSTIWCDEWWSIVDLK